MERKDISEYEAIEPNELLSGRELEVLQLVADGETSKSIAASLNISEKTLETYKKHVTNIALSYRQSRGSKGIKIVFTALIIDGIQSAYIKPQTLEGTTIEDLSASEYDEALVRLSGGTDKDIAKQLDITENHKRQIYRKLGVSNHFGFTARFAYLEMCGFFKEHEPPQLEGASQ